MFEWLSVHRVPGSNDAATDVEAQNGCPERTLVVVCALS